MHDSGFARSAHLGRDLDRGRKNPGSTWVSSPACRNHGLASFRRPRRSLWSVRHCGRGFHGLTSRPARDRPGRPRRPPDAPAHGPLAHRPPDSPHGLGAFRPPKRPTGRLTQAPRALLGFGRCAGPFSPVHDGRRSDRTYPDCTMAAGGYLHICPLRVRACRKSRFRVSPDRRQAGCKMSFSRGSATTPGDDDRTPPGRGDDKDLGTRHPHSPESTSRSGLNR